MYTRCPTCSTCFRVTDRHLAIANGKVRCGKCQLVFNAPEHAIDDLPVKQNTSPVESKPQASPSVTKPSIEKPPKSVIEKKVAPAPIAPTAKEKQEEKANKETPKFEFKKPLPKTEVAFDSNATLITDTSTLDINQVENINLDEPSDFENTINGGDDNVFDNNFDMDAAINEFTNPIDKDKETEEKQNENIIEQESSIKIEEEKDNIFSTDVYDATSASSVADILHEMEGQLSLNIPEQGDDKNDDYDANKEFDFLQINNEHDDTQETDLNSNEENVHDEFEIIDFDDDNEDEEQNENNNKEVPLNEDSPQEEHFDVELDDQNDFDEDELFDQVDLSDFDDDEDESEEIILEESSFENSELQNIGQHADEHDVPLQLRKDLEHLNTSQKSWHPLLAPTFLIFLLIFSFAQLTYFRAHELVKQIPASRPLLEAFCETLGCNYSGPRDTKQIQLLSRDVRLHPKEKNALLISAAMINNAYFSQPYPKIHIRLSDISGNVVAERIFNAKTYMGKLNNPFLLMKSKTPVHINFEVVDPGKDAINFEFTFL